MKRYALLLLALVFATGGVIWVIALRPVGAASAPRSLSRPPSPGEPNTAMTPISEAPRPVPEAPPAAEPVAPLPPLIADEAKAKDRIGLLGATLDEAYVAELVRYLAHPIPDVRHAALNSLLLIGDASAVPLLRAAADNADRNPETATEALSWREAAEVLAAPKPPGDTKPQKRTLAELEAAGPRQRIAEPGMPK